MFIRDSTLEIFSCSLWFHGHHQIPRCSNKCHEEVGMKSVIQRGFFAAITLFKLGVSCLWGYDFILFFCISAAWNDHLVKIEWKAYFSVTRSWYQPISQSPCCPQVAHSVTVSFIRCDSSGPIKWRSLTSVLLVEFVQSGDGRLHLPSWSNFFLRFLCSLMVFHSWRSEFVLRVIIKLTLQGFYCHRKRYKNYHSTM